jgi:peptide/nickel transport system permease protein
MGMTHYIIRRLLWAVVIVYFVATASFFMINAAPGDAIMAKLAQGGRVTEAELEEKRAQLGLDEPLLEQYLTWLGNALQGDLGNSLLFESRTVTGQIADTFPKTLELVIYSTIISLVVAIPVGVISAVKQDGPVDVVARLLAIIGLAIPTFFLGTVIVIYGAKWFGVSPANDQPGFLSDPLANLKTYLAPSLVLGFSLAAVVLRMTRATVLEVMRQDFVRTARAKGLKERIVIYRHVIKNSLIPVITVFGNQFAFLIGGTVIVEQIFNIQGMGELIFFSINARDFTQVMGNTLFLGTLVVLVNLVVDISYAWVDPRIRYS